MTPNTNSVIVAAIFDAVGWYEAADWFGGIVSPRSQLWTEAVLAQEKVEFGTNVLIHKTLIEYPVPLSKTIDSNIPKKLWTVPWSHLFMENDSPVYDKSLHHEQIFLINCIKSLNRKELNQNLKTALLILIAMQRFLI